MALEIPENITINTQDIPYFKTEEEVEKYLSSFQKAYDEDVKRLLNTRETKHPPIQLNEQQYNNLRKTYTGRKWLKAREEGI